MKEIIITIKLNKYNDTDDEVIIKKLKEWIKDNFWNGSKAEIYIKEDEKNRLE